MRKEDIQDVVRRIPPNDLTLTVLSLRNGATITIDAVIRYEPTYLVIRGREGGTTDDGRGFFVPYDDISYLKMDKLTKASDLRRMYGETVALDFEEQMAAGVDGAAASATTPAPVAAGGTDPASIAKQNLLARIRAARTSGGGPPAAPGK